MEFLMIYNSFQFTACSEQGMYTVTKMSLLSVKNLQGNSKELLKLISEELKISITNNFWSTNIRSKYHHHMTA